MPGGRERVACERDREPADRLAALSAQDLGAGGLGRRPGGGARPAHRDQTLSKPRPREWLLIEWPPGEDEPTKYRLSTLPADSKRADLVNTVKMRWRVERDDQDLKQEVGLGHYEGRGWRGFHHHATLRVAA